MLHRFRHRQRALAIGLLLLPLLVACGQPKSAATPAEQYDSTVPLRWYQLMLTLVETTPGWTPPVVARAFGYLGVALYESVVPGMPANRSLVGQLNDLAALPQADPQRNYHWPTAANAAMETLIRQLFNHTTDANHTRIEQLAQQQAADLQSQTDPLTYARSNAFGTQIAWAIYSWSLADGAFAAEAHNFPPDYTVSIKPGLWEPTSADYPIPLQPYWGNNRTFALKNGAECQPPAPPAYSEDASSEFYAQAHEVYTSVRDITPEQRAIAAFWADNPGSSSTPPGHSISLLNQQIAERSPSLAFAAQAYAQLGIALADAFISNWYTKYQYDLVRPITYIHALIDPNWRTVVATPPFPEYTSGHSVQSGAMEVVLTALFGDVAFSDHTHQQHGMPTRTFTSFHAAAEEAAISRLYGGIHYRAAIENGVTQGRCVGQKALDLKFKR